MNEDKNSANDVVRTLHETINLTFSSLDQKIDDLAKQFSERRHRAMEALHALNGGMVHTGEEDTTEDVVTPSAPQENETKDETHAMPSVPPRYYIKDRMSDFIHKPFTNKCMLTTLVTLHWFHCQVNSLHSHTHQNTLLHQEWKFLLTLDLVLHIPLTFTLDLVLHIPFCI